jgi:serine/threonine protein kinase
MSHPVVRNEGSTEEEDDLFKEGDIIDDKYKVIRRLGKGGYGEIYAALHLKSGEPVAVKVERLNKPGNLLEEERILRNLKDCRYVPRLLATGRHRDQVNYIVLELLGENLSTLRRRMPEHKFSMVTTALLGMQMLRAIKEVHDHGYLHRDIKPGNFVMGTKRTNNPRTVILIDFGLSRRHFRPDGGVRPKRKSARWVGSRRYMSLNTHLRKEQGRRDDLWSLLYVLIEFATGTVPWAHLRGLSNLDKVRDMKQAYYNEKLVKGLPDEFLKFMNHLKTLKYADRPNYEYLHELLKGLCEKYGGNENSAFDWEVLEAQGNQFVGSDLNLGITLTPNSGPEQTRENIANVEDNKNNNTNTNDNAENGEKIHSDQKPQEGIEAPADIRLPDGNAGLLKSSEKQNVANEKSEEAMKTQVNDNQEHQNRKNDSLSGKTRRRRKKRRPKCVIQ